MSTREAGAIIFSLLCVLWPGLWFVAGLLIGRHGIRHAASLVLTPLASKRELAQAEISQ